MTVDIKENTLIFRGTVKNCNSYETMIVTLIPFFLAATLESPSDTSWKHATEVTYLINNNAKTIYPGGANSKPTEFNLRAMLTCQQYQSSLFCHFHDVHIETFSVDAGQPRKRIQETQDSWTTRALQADTFEIDYERNGEGKIRFSEKIQPVARDMMQTLVRLLIIGTDLSQSQSGMLETAFNIANRHCRTHFQIERHSGMSSRTSSIRELILIGNYRMNPPLKIVQKVDKIPACMDKSHWYSFAIAKGKGILGDPRTIESQLDIAENFIVIDQQNFTSFSRIIATVKNHKDNTRHIVEESISLSLQGINTPVYPYCNDDDRHFHINFSNENKKYLPY